MVQSEEVEEVAALVEQVETYLEVVEHHTLQQEVVEDCVVQKTEEYWKLGREMRRQNYRLLLRYHRGSRQLMLRPK